MHRAMSRVPRTSRVTSIDAHVGGAPVRLIVGGAPAPVGESFAERARDLSRRADTLRRLVMCEPRGHRAMVGAMFVDPGDEAEVGLVFLDGEGWPPLCGHGVIGAMTIAIERGLLTTGASPGGSASPSSLRLRTPAATLDVSWTFAAAHPSRVESVSYEGPAATVVASAIALPLGARTLRGDVVDFGGRHLVIDGEASGVSLDVAGEHELTRAARRMTDAYEETALARATGVALDAVVFVGPPHGDDADVRCGVVFEGTGLDRGPSGSATGALCALLDAMGAVAEGYVVTVEGPLGTKLRASVRRRVAVDGAPAIVPAISGAAAITGDHVFYADPA